MSAWFSSWNADLEALLGFAESSGWAQFGIVQATGPGGFWLGSGSTPELVRVVREQLERFGPLTSFDLFSSAGHLRWSGGAGLLLSAGPQPAGAPPPVETGLESRPRRYQLETDVVRHRGLAVARGFAEISVHELWSPRLRRCQAVQFAELHGGERP